MILRALARLPRSIAAAARQAMREHVLGEVDRVLRGILESGIESYGLRGPGGDVIEVTPDVMLAMIGAVRARLRSEL